MSGSNGLCWFYVEQNVVIEANSLLFDNMSKYADHCAETILLLYVSVVAHKSVLMITNFTQRAAV